MTAEKRLSNEFADTIGCAPATRLGAGKAGAGAGAAAAVSVAAGFKGGRAAACLVSAFGAKAFANSVVALSMASRVFSDQSMARSSRAASAPVVFLICVSGSREAGV